MIVICMLFVLLFLLLLLSIYVKLKPYHVNRNKYNTPPVGELTHIKGNTYRDENDVLWVQRGFLNSLLHNPFKYYVFETYDTQNQSSSEVKILKTHFDTREMKFQPASFNYYSSFRFPIKHFFADVLPIFTFF